MEGALSYYLVEITRCAATRATKDGGDIGREDLDVARPERQNRLWGRGQRLENGIAVRTIYARSLWG